MRAEPTVARKQITFIAQEQIFQFSIISPCRTNTL